MPGPPVEATTFASLPPEIRSLIFQNGSIVGEADFIVCTANRHGDDSAMPMRGISHDADLVVRGIPIGGMLYVTKIYGLEDRPNVGGFQADEPHPEARVFATNDVYTRRNQSGEPIPASNMYHPTTRHNKRCAQILGKTAAKNAQSEWYAEVYRDSDSDKIKWNRPEAGLAMAEEGKFGTLVPWAQDNNTNPRHGYEISSDVGERKDLPKGHRFYADAKTRKLYLSLTNEEDRLLRMRHDITSVRPVENAPWAPENPREWSRLQTRMTWREEDIRSSESSVLLPIENGRVNREAGHQGTNVLISLSKRIEVRSENKIIASIPILSRIAPPQPDDELLAHPAVSGQLKSPSDMARVRSGRLDLPLPAGRQGQPRIGNHPNGRNRYVHLDSCMDHCERHLPLIGSDADAHRTADEQQPVQNGRRPAPGREWLPEAHRAASPSTVQAGRRGGSRPRKSARAAVAPSRRLLHEADLL